MSSLTLTNGLEVQPGNSPCIKYAISTNIKNQVGCKLSPKLGEGGYYYFKSG